jgi:hypothetical protein
MSSFRAKSNAVEKSALIDLSIPLRSSRDDENDLTYFASQSFIKLN